MIRNKNLTLEAHPRIILLTALLITAMDVPCVTFPLTYRVFGLRTCLELHFLSLQRHFHGLVEDMCRNAVSTCYLTLLFTILLLGLPRVLGKGQSYKYNGGENTNDSNDTNTKRKILDLENTPYRPDNQGGFPPQDYCRDLRPKCYEWAMAGGCAEDPDYMLPHCPVSCQACDQRVVYDVTEPFGQLEEYAEYMYDAVGGDLGVPQLLDSPNMARKVEERVKEAQKYVQDVVMKEDRYTKARPLCKNHNFYCALKAVQGECESNESYMLNNCAPVCFRCDFLHVESLCPIDPLEKNCKNQIGIVGLLD